MEKACCACTVCEKRGIHVLFLLFLCLYWLFLLSPLSFSLSTTLLSLVLIYPLSLWDDAKWPTRIDLSLNHNTNTEIQNSLFQGSGDADQEDEANSESDNEVDEAPQGKNEGTKKSKARKRKDSEDDGDWEKYQEEFKKENILDTKKKESWPVHCPYFPEVRRWTCSKD